MHTFLCWCVSSKLPVAIGTNDEAHDLDDDAARESFFFFFLLGSENENIFFATTHAHTHTDTHTDTHSEREMKADWRRERKGGKQRGEGVWRTEFFFFFAFTSHSRGPPNPSIVFLLHSFPSASTNHQKKNANRDCGNPHIHTLHPFATSTHKQDYQALAHSYTTTMINDANNIVLAVVGLPLELLFVQKRDTLHEALVFSHGRMTLISRFSFLAGSRWQRKVVHPQFHHSGTPLPIRTRCRCRLSFFPFD